MDCGFGSVLFCQSFTIPPPRVIIGIVVIVHDDVQTLYSIWTNINIILRFVFASIVVMPSTNDILPINQNHKLHPLEHGWSTITIHPVIGNIVFLFIVAVASIKIVNMMIQQGKQSRHIRALVNAHHSLKWRAHAAQVVGNVRSAPGPDLGQMEQRRVEARISYRCRWRRRRSRRLYPCRRKRPSGWFLHVPSPGGALTATAVADGLVDGADAPALLSDGVPDPRVEQRAVDED
mmetsp:Transcript_36244/g.87471  ORF Transcript_36244/g.87471 Transcript_36244/m.87471 type:complete len:234 (-) Transcript_36244:120-821(-)